MLAKSNFNSIDTLRSQALIDMDISHEEFITKGKRQIIDMDISHEEFNLKGKGQIRNDERQFKK